ncbi:hypothetical protein [Micromonospora sp. NPDC048063]|uniref:hypothetical protein n=1 Tax=Micromonospora sp. NPDC048063 TaxID=3364256 RepID=UPI003721C351
MVASSSIVSWETVPPSTARPSTRWAISMTSAFESARRWVQRMWTLVLVFTASDSKPWISSEK